MEIEYFVVSILMVDIICGKAYILYAFTTRKAGIPGLNECCVRKTYRAEVDRRKHTVATRSEHNNATAWHSNLLSC